MKGASNKVLTIAVVLLLLVNVTMLVFMLKNKKQHSYSKGDRPNPVEYMAKELGMSEEQKAGFQKARDQHFAAMKPLFDSMGKIRKTFLDLVRNTDSGDSTVNVYSSRVAAIQAEIDKLTLAHFRNVRSMFTGEQLDKYDEFVQKMMQRRRGGPGGRSEDSAGKRN